MDAQHFDALTRRLTLRLSRRRSLGLLGTLSLRGLVSPNVVAAKKKKPCPPCKKRKKGKCKGTLPDGTGCAGGTCQRGVCQPPVPLPPGDPCPGQKRCNGVCIPTNQCCTTEDCPASGGYRCCNGVCTDEKGGTGFNCTSDTQCCSGYCRLTSPGSRTCAATCRGKSCFQGSGCCREHACLTLNNNGDEYCGGCLDRTIFCESEAECCASACTATPADSTLKQCLSYAGGRCEENLDCRSCYVNNQCIVPINGATRNICTNGVCGCPDGECCSDSNCPPQKTCVLDAEGLNGVCTPIITPP